MKIRAVVLKIDPNSKTMLVATPSREFRRVPLPGKPVQVGEEIEIEVKLKKKNAPSAPVVYGEEADKNARRRSLFPSAVQNWTRYLSIAAAFFLLALVGLYTGQVLVAEPSYIAIDINPSVELAVDDKLRVTELIPRNSDGKKLLAGMETTVKKSNLLLDEAIDAIINKAIDLGYLKKNGNYSDNVIVVSVIPSTHPFWAKLPVFEQHTAPDKEPLSTKNQKLSAALVENIIIEKLTSARIESTLVVEKTTQEARKQAIAKGLSVNQYLVYSRSAAKNDRVPPASKLKGLSLKDTISALPGSSTLLPPGKIIKKNADTDNKVNASSTAPDKKEVKKQENKNFEHKNFEYKNLEHKNMDTKTPNKSPAQQKITVKEKKEKQNNYPDTPSRNLKNHDIDTDANVTNNNIKTDKKTEKRPPEKEGVKPFKKEHNDEKSPEAITPAAPAASPKKRVINITLRK